jgi:hypothetical protein
MEPGMLRVGNTTVSGDDHVVIIDVQGIQAVVNWVDADEFDEDRIPEQVKNLSWVEEKAFAHENVIEEVMGDNPVVPMQFCTIYRNLDNMTEFMETYLEQLLGFLDMAEACQEWSVKVVCDTAKMTEAIKGRQRFQEDIESISRKTSGIAFMLNKKLQERIEVCVQETLSNDIQRIFESLADLWEDVSVEDIVEGASTERRTVLRITALLNQNRLERFFEAIEFMVLEYGNQGYTFETSGPWPIYHFIAFSENVEREVDHV